MFHQCLRWNCVVTTVSHIGATVITEVCVHHTGCFSWKSSPLWLQGVSRLPRRSSATHHRLLTEVWWSWVQVIFQILYIWYSTITPFSTMLPLSCYTSNISTYNCSRLKGLWGRNLLPSTVFNCFPLSCCLLFLGFHNMFDVLLLLCTF